MVFFRKTTSLADLTKMVTDVSGLWEFHENICIEIHKMNREKKCFIYYEHKLFKEKYMDTEKYFPD